MLGLLFNPDYLKTDLLPSIIKQHLSSKEINWQIIDRYGNVVLNAEESPSGGATIKASFTDHIPPWTLELFQQDLNLFNTLLFSRHSVYFYIFILTAIILTFGLYLMIHTLTHELELARMKSNFVSAISHDLKSPVTSIRQLSEMLQAGRVPSKERRQRYHDVLVEQSERLSTLIDNVLDSARMEEGQAEYFFEKVDIKELLEEIVSKIQHRVQHHGFTIETQMEKNLPEILIDRAAIIQAITNLVDNAIKFSSNAKLVKVKLFKENEQIAISVKDRGIGIKKAEIIKIFERFYRSGDEKIRHTKGSGLGLTLVKQIVETHHGTVHVESELGKGSIFTIKLPIDLKES